MNIDDLNKRIDDSYKVNITDIFGRRVYPGDVVYCVSQWNNKIEIGIVSKLTDKSCKLLGDNRLFGPGELCILKGNENAAIPEADALRLKLKKDEEEKAAKAAIKKKDVIYIMKTADGKKYFGMKSITFTNRADMVDKLEKFSKEEKAIVKFLCRTKDLAPYFSSNAKDSNMYMTGGSNSCFYKETRARYISSEMKAEYRDKIEDAVQSYIKGAFLYSRINKANQVIRRSSVDEVDNSDYQMVFDEDFLFLTEKDEIVGSSKYMISFDYYFLHYLVKNFYRFKKYEFRTYDSWDSEREIVRNMFITNRNESVDRLIEMYSFLKKKLIEL